MTIHELKRLNKANGGLFFNRRGLAATGDTLKGFGVRQCKQNPGVLIVTRKNTGTEILFSKTTGRVIIDAI